MTSPVAVWIEAMRIKDDSALARRAHHGAGKQETRASVVVPLARIRSDEAKRDAVTGSSTRTSTSSSSTDYSVSSHLLYQPFQRASAASTCERNINGDGSSTYFRLPPLSARRPPTPRVPDPGSQLTDASASTRISQLSATERLVSPRRASSSARHYPQRAAESRLAGTLAKHEELRLLGVRPSRIAAIAGELYSRRAAVASPRKLPTPRIARQHVRV